MSINVLDICGSHEISCMTYSHLYQIYFIVTTDFKLHVLNEYLNYIGWYPFKIRLIKFINFEDEGSKLIVAGIDGCYTI